MKNKEIEISEADLKYLQLLASRYPNRDSVSTEIINLQAILNLPKGTEHFISDIHGEYEAFFHVLKNGSGIIKEKIEMLFEKELTSSQMRELATLTYYPRETIQRISSKEEQVDEWYEINLYRMIRLCKLVTAKYTRARVRKFLPKEFSYIIEELLYEHEGNKKTYYQEIINTITELDRADAFICALAGIIQQFAVAHLHIIGDIYDRGPGAHIIMDRLLDYHSMDIQWGNHDILWMGAAAGSLACVANVIRLSLRYGNLKTLEEGYGISLRPLALFAYDYYDKDECLKFMPKETASDKKFSGKDKDELSKMHKSIAIIQHKLEAQIVMRNGQWGMLDRKVFDNIDLEKGLITLDGNQYELNDCNFPTIDINDPYALNEDEIDVIKQLQISFKKSEKLQRHVQLLYSRGGLYRCHNRNLLFHGCIPMTGNGKFKEIVIKENSYSGKALIDRFDKYARQGFFDTDKERKSFGEDVLWYLWAGNNSPLFAKAKMATFERYFIDNSSAHKEEKNPYYSFRDDEKICNMILEEFGLDAETGHIVNGHVPVKVKKGEKPMKCDGKLLVIDGGFSKAYQGVTGIAGYTLVFNSHGMSLVSHEPFKSTEDAIINGTDIESTRITVSQLTDRIMVKDTDTGKKIALKIESLKELLVAFRQGFIVEQWKNDCR